MFWLAKFKPYALPFWCVSFIAYFTLTKVFCLRQIFSYIRDSCSCKIEECDGHQFLDFVELIYQFECYSVKKKKVYFKYFFFHNFRLTSNIKMTLKPTKLVTMIQSMGLIIVGYKQKKANFKTLNKVWLDFTKKQCWKAR